MTRWDKFDFLFEYFHRFHLWSDGDRFRRMIRWIIGEERITTCTEISCDAPRGMGLVCWSENGLRGKVGGKLL